MAASGRSIQRIDGKVFFDGGLYYYGKVENSSEPRFIESASINASEAQKIEFFERAAAVESVDMRIRVMAPIENGEDYLEDTSADGRRALREIQIPTEQNGTSTGVLNGNDASSDSSSMLRNGNNAGTIGYYHVSDGLSTTDEEHDLELITERRRIRRSRRDRNAAQASNPFDSATAMLVLTNEQIQTIDNTDSLDELEDNLEYNLILIRRRRRQILRREERMANLADDSDTENAPPARSRRRVVLPRDSD